MKQKRAFRRVSFHTKRIALLGVLFIALFGVRLDAAAVDTGSGHVLAYASEMSRGELFNGTNAARAANGLGGFLLNDKLNNAAQAKAEHMAAHDYWAHVAPDGTQPWHFFTQAGYNYVRAGENLAYGFGTSQAAINGWMNSPGHRANILGDFMEVGFGIVNAPNYQGRGQQTIVVAHYGSRATQTAPQQVAPPSASTPTPTPAPAPAPTAQPSEQAEPPIPSTPSTPTSETPPNDESKEDTQAPNSNDREPDAVPTATATTQPPGDFSTSSSSSDTTVLGLLSNRMLPAAALLSLTTVSLSIVGYATLHRRAFEHAVVSGEKFALRHPTFDTAVVAGIVAAILLTSYGSIL